MKKLKIIIRNLYRITLSNRNGVKSSYSLTERSREECFCHTERNREECFCHTERSRSATGNMNEDSYIRKTLHLDTIDVEPDPELLQILIRRVEARRKPSKENSFFFIPAFLLRNMEFKMAAITLIIVIALGVNPSVQYQANRKISPFSLADTLIDSSKLEMPFVNQQNP